MSRVFIVQVPKRWDPSTRRRVEVHDLTPAAHLGTFVEVFDSDAQPDDEAVVARLEQVMGDFQPQDYILPLGNPILIGLAMTWAYDVLSEGDWSPRILQWSRRDGEYRVVQQNLF